MNTSECDDHEGEWTAGSIGREGVIGKRMLEGRLVPPPSLATTRSLNHCSEKVRRDNAFVLIVKR